MIIPQQFTLNVVIQKTNLSILSVTQISVYVEHYEREYKGKHMLWCNN